MLNGEIGEPCNSEEYRRHFMQTRNQKRTLSQVDLNVQKISLSSQILARPLQLCSLVRTSTPISEFRYTFSSHVITLSGFVPEKSKCKCILPSSSKEADVVGMVMSSQYKLEARNVSHPVFNSCIDYTAGMRCDRQRRKFSLKVVIMVIRLKPCRSLIHAFE